MWSRVPRSAGTPWLVAGAALSAAAALLHLAVIAGGPDWYRFFGAGERMAQMAEREHWYPPVITIGIATVLAGWALVALSGAGLTLRVPLLRTGLAAITAIYLARGLLIVPVIMLVPYPEGAFDYWSSLIVLVYGLVYAIGLWRAWPALRPRPKSSIA
jgi:hypothetical protein